MVLVSDACQLCAGAEMVAASSGRVTNKSFEHFFPLQMALCRGKPTTRESGNQIIFAPPC